MENPLTPKQIRQAAKLYSLSLVAHLDEGCLTSQQAKVTHVAVRNAQRALLNRGINYVQLATLDDCIHYVTENLKRT